MDIIPAIDIMDGRCVRLRKGEFESRIEYENTPAETAAMFRSWGVQRIHVVDLDGARSGKVCNLSSLEEIAGAADLVIDFSGGIQTEAEARDAFDRGASMICCSTIAVQNPGLFSRLMERFGPGKVILSADSSFRRIRIDGWQRGGGMDIFDFLEHYRVMGVKTVIATAIERDGMLRGPDLSFYRALRAIFPELSIIASGGVTSSADLLELEAAGCQGAIVGKAVYEGKITAEDIGGWNLSVRRSADETGGPVCRPKE